MDGGGNEFGRRLDRWAAELRSVEAAAGRGRQGWLERQAGDESTFLGVLADLAERNRPVVVELVTGRRHRGVLRVVGPDVCALRTDARVDVIVSAGAITSVRSVPGDGPTTGDRAVATTTSLADAVATVAAPGARVAVWCMGGAPIAGEVVAVGRDVVRLRLDAGAGWAYVALASLAELSVAESG